MRKIFIIIVIVVVIIIIRFLSALARPRAAHELFQSVS